MSTLLQAYEEAFIERTPRSRHHFQQAQLKLAGGVGGNNKFMKPHPLYALEGDGSRIVDVDGNEYIDLLMGAGALILGHRSRPVLDAVREQAERGTHFVLATELEWELASRIVKHMPYVERLRFTSTGSEATIMTLRVARAYTGREKVAKFDGHFHGHAHDALSFSSIVPSGDNGSRLTPTPDWAGIPAHAAADVLVLPFDDADESVELLEENASELAALILEPVPFSSLGGITPAPGLLERIREVTREHGILLIYDEIITGFRLCLGGAGTYFGIEPDLVAMGKIIGGGLPLGAYGGREAIIEQVVTPTREPSDAENKIFQSGTFSANPLSLAAGIVTIDELERLHPYPELALRADHLRKGLAGACSSAGIEARLTGVESIFHIHFTHLPIRSHRDAQTSDKLMNREFCFGLITRGIFWPLLHGGFLSTSHSDSDVEALIETAQEVLAEMADTRVSEPLRT